LICSFNFLILLAECLNILSTVINIKILTNSNHDWHETQSYKFTSHIAAFSVVLITEMHEICIQTSYDQNVQLILLFRIMLLIQWSVNTFVCHVVILMFFGRLKYIPRRFSEYMLAFLVEEPMKICNKLNP
jgi:hypothetical protein